MGMELYLDTCNSTLWDCHFGNIREQRFLKRFYSPNNDNTWNCVCNLYYFGWRNPYLSLCFQLLIDMLHVRIYSTCGQHLSNQLGISSSIQWIPVTWTLDKVCSRRLRKPSPFVSLGVQAEFLNQGMSNLKSIRWLNEWMNKWKVKGQLPHIKSLFHSSRFSLEA